MAAPSVKADWWEHWIMVLGQMEEYVDVLKGICNGFSHRIDPLLNARKPFIPNNLTSALKHIDVIGTYLAQ